MIRTLALLPGFAAVSLFSTACQTASPKLPALKPGPAKPFPAWTKNTSLEPKSNRKVFIQTKVIEVQYPAGSPDIPTGRYEKKLSDPEFQIAIRELADRKGVDLMTAPSVVTRDSQKAKVEIVREFIYPVAPGENAKKECENVGVTAHFLAGRSGKNAIDLKVFTRVTELEGYSQVTEDFSLPVFKRRDLTTSTTLRSGETVMIGGIVDESTQDIQDSGPLGIVRKSRTERFSRELILVVTPQWVDSSGRPLDGE